VIGIDVQRIDSHILDSYVLDSYVLDSYVLDSYVLDSYVLDSYVLDTLMRDLVGHDRKPTSFLVYLWLWAEQSKDNSPVGRSYQEIAESVGISKSSAQAAITWLLRRKLLAVTRVSVTATPSYRVLTPWQRPTPQRPTPQRAS